MMQEPFLASIGISEWWGLAVLAGVYAWVFRSFFPPFGLVLQRLADLHFQRSNRRNTK